MRPRKIRERYLFFRDEWPFQDERILINHHIDTCQGKEMRPKTCWCLSKLFVVDQPRGSSSTRWAKWRKQAIPDNKDTGISAFNAAEYVWASSEQVISKLNYSRRFWRWPHATIWWPHDSKIFQESIVGAALAFMTFCACRIVPVLLLFRALVSLKLCACSFFTRTLTVCVCWYAGASDSARSRL